MGFAQTVDSKGKPIHRRDELRTCHVYDRVNGHVTRDAAVTTTWAAAPVVVGSAEDGGGDGGDCGGGSGGGGGGGSGEDGGDGGGDGEPPTTAGPAPDGDGQHNILNILLLLFICLDGTFRLVFYLPVLFALAVYRCVPSLPRVWLCLPYVFPDRVRHEVIRPHIRTLRRDRRRVKRTRLPLRAWVGFWLRVRTLLLVLLAVIETLKDIAFGKGEWPEL